MDHMKFAAMPFPYKLARFSMILRKAYPFLGELCMRVNKYRRQNSFSMAATDGYHLYLDEERMAKLPEESFNFILLHELFHIVLRHTYPKDLAASKRIYWNIAFDLIANWLILQMKGGLSYRKLPVQPVSDTCLTLDDLSGDPSHSIAASFIRQATEQGAFSNVPPPPILIRWKSFQIEVLQEMWYIGDILSGDASDAPFTEADIQDLLSSCIKVAGLGGLPQYLRNLMDEVTQGRKLPWHILLRRYLEAMTDYDEFDYVPPDKRTLYRGLILPAHSEADIALQHALVVLDVSSSVGKDELLTQVWQIESMMRDLAYTGSIIAFACEVHQEAPLTDKPSLKRFIDELQVGGGTDWSSVVDFVKRQRLPPKPIIVFTDGYFFDFTEGLANVIFITQGEYPDALGKLGHIIRIN